jgi:hypothetical protein
MKRHAPLLLVLALLLSAIHWGSPGWAAEEKTPIIFHVKTALSIDDAQICAVPNVAWAALARGRSVVIVFDGSAVTSVAKGYGWRGWIGLTSTAMDRADLPERERGALAKQFGVPLETVPRDYGEYLHFIKGKGAKLYYNATMALLYKIPREKIDESLKPLELSDLLTVFETPGTYLVY